MSDSLQNNTEYTLDELVAWLSARSRVCSTPLWPLALKGQVVFEVGDYTYKITHTSGDNYLIHSFAHNKFYEKTHSARRTFTYVVIFAAIVIVLTILNS